MAGNEMIKVGGHIKGGDGKQQGTNGYRYKACGGRKAIACVCDIRKLAQFNFDSS